MTGSVVVRCIWREVLSVAVGGVVPTISGMLVIDAGNFLCVVLASNK